MTKHQPQLMPAAQLLQSPKENDFQNQQTEIKTIFQVNQRAKIQECNYQGQMYLPGDIVKTNQGWIRCSSEVSFGKSQQKGELDWVANQ